ncbi:hypothetical protein BB561_006413 [Smittium simulii]|uniref:Uncharacterized protein n=1 Tax=Smittium simulii TaxID=133385 RepID=A0A2T9Y4H8_9FUNG|nr:hypothetical protein BB561_006413 [Smittium simulii]
MNFLSFLASLFAVFATVLTFVASLPAIEYVTVYETVRIRRPAVTVTTSQTTLINSQSAVNAPQPPLASAVREAETAIPTPQPTIDNAASQADVAPLNVPAAKALQENTFTPQPTLTQTAPTLSATLPTASPRALNEQIPMTTVSGNNPAFRNEKATLLPQVDLPIQTTTLLSKTEALPTTKPSNNANAVPGTCKFLWSSNNSDNVVPITPDGMNAGWAMSPDQACKPGQWCPYACAPGYYSTQWNPKSAQPNGPGSMDGGLFCDANGVLQKPFEDKPYCAPSMDNVKIRNNLQKSVSACQTVYPGNESMLIPTVAQAQSTSPLNIVPNTYWLGTSSHFYINLSGSDANQCIWGNPDKPVGNWAPYIFGGGQGKDGNTYISMMYNPLYIESGFKPSDAYNVKINCVEGFCNFPAGGECKCEGGNCSVSGSCTVTLAKNAKAEFVLY